jgi:hypothetical protein
MKLKIQIIIVLNTLSVSQLKFHKQVFYFSRLGVKINQIQYSASQHIQKLRLAADTPQFLEITELSRAHHLRSLVLFLLFTFRGENKSDTIFSIPTYSEAEIGS